MNIYQKEVLLSLEEDKALSQRELAKKLNLSLGTINNALTGLKDKNYVDQDGQLTTEAMDILEHAKPRNAIILAAGYGMRMVPINTETPKGLLTIKQEPLIERIIKQLHNANITDISIIVGFMKEQYEYLIDEYNVRLIFNDQYHLKNNLHSLFLASDKISDTYIIPSDVWCKKNPFRKHELYSWYMVTNEISKKSMVHLNRKKELIVSKNQNNNKMIGISFIYSTDADILKRNLSTMDADPFYDNSYWEEALINTGKMLTFGRCASQSETFEIDTYEQLRDIDSESNHLKTDAIEIIEKVFNVSNELIQNIKVLKKGMTNRSFLFSIGNQSYIMRIPGEGTDRLINRKEEAEVYAAINPYHICDEVIYLNPSNGYKITRYYENSRVCNPNDNADLISCIRELKKLHSLDLKVNHVFDLFEKINFYESLWTTPKSIFKDYEKTKKDIFSLKSYIDHCEKDWSLTHIDAVPDNFLFLDNGEVKLIDWEYASMQDPHVDIAMFCIYAMYDSSEIDQFIDLYFDGSCDFETRTKIYAYIAICGLLWSNWCEYKRNLGVEFGEYSLAQYRYAKNYFKKVKERLGANA